MYGIVLFGVYMFQLHGIYVKIGLKSVDTVHMCHMAKSCNSIAIQLQMSLISEVDCNGFFLCVSIEITDKYPHY